MKIARLEIIELKIPFRFTFRHSLAARSEGHGILVRIEDEDGHIGWGECVPRSYVTGETPASVQEALRDGLALPFAHASFDGFDDVVASLEHALTDLPRDQHAAFCALELAMLDLAGRVYDRSAGEVCGPVASSEIEYSGVVSSDGLASAIKVLELLREFGFRRVKLKVGGDPQDDISLLQHARAVLGPDCKLRIDANCAWDVKTALERLDAFAPFDLESVEQPLPGDDLDGLAKLTPRSPVPVIVDESLASTDDARTLIDRGACHHFNIRISKCAGLINAARVRDLGRAAGVGCQLGAQVGETVLLTAAGRHFAASTEEILFCEGSFGTILLESDIGAQDLTLRSGGPAPGLSGPGLGVEVDADKLAPYVASTIVLGDG
ncbi:MAG: hypothetical protein CMJ83_12880 [Planctomycetes bacterium]|nr:hypothetical protein [Planctomycetota bacterium]